MNTLYDKTAFEEEPDTKETETPSEEDLEMFRQQVSEWTKLDDHIKKLSVAIRERRIHQRAISTKIQEFMRKHGYDNLNTQSGRIKSTVRQVKVPLKVADIKDKIVSLSSLSGEQLIEKIFEEERPLVEKTSLRRIIPKVSMSLDI